MYICISIYRDVYYIYVPGHARAHTRLYTGAGPDHFERLSDCVAAPAMPSASAYRQRLLQAPHSVHSRRSRWRRRRHRRTPCLSSGTRRRLSRRRRPSAQTETQSNPMASPNGARFNGPSARRTPRSSIPVRSARFHPPAAASCTVPLQYPCSTPAVPLQYRQYAPIASTLPSDRRPRPVVCINLPSPTRRRVCRRAAARRKDCAPIACGRAEGVTETTEYRYSTAAVPLRYRSRAGGRKAWPRQRSTATVPLQYPHGANRARGRAEGVARDNGRNGRAGMRR